MSQKKQCKCCGTRERVSTHVFPTGRINLCSKNSCYTKQAEREQERLFAWQE